MDHKDYLTILKFYGINISDMKKTEIKEKAEGILADKLCRCIKKVNEGAKDETRAIAICNASVLKRKGIKPMKFKCKKRPRFITKKKSKSTNKTRRKTK
jgi:hypothetical protein